MILIAAMLLVAFAIAITSFSRAQFVDDRPTHHFVGTPGGRCQVPGCGKPYASDVHHDQR